MMMMKRRISSSFPSAERCGEALILKFAGSLTLTRFRPLKDAERRSSQVLNPAFGWEGFRPLKDAERRSSYPLERPCQAFDKTCHFHGTLALFVRKAL